MVQFNIRPSLGRVDCDIHFHFGMCSFFTRSVSPGLIWFIHNYPCAKSALTCAHLSFACVYLHTFVPVCFQLLVCVYFCVFSFTLICSYLYTEPIGFFSSVRIYLTHRPICSCLCTSTLVCVHLLSYLRSLVVAGTRFHSFVLASTCLCLSMLAGTHFHSFVLVYAHRYLFELIHTCWHLLVLSAQIPALVPAGTPSTGVGTDFCPARVQVWPLRPQGLPLQFPSLCLVDWNFQCPSRS